VDTVSADSGGYINLLIANSGTIGPLAPYNPEESVAQLRKRMFTDVKMEDFTQTFHINVTGALFTMLAFLELLDAGNKSAVEKGTFGAPTSSGGKVPSIQSQVIVTGSIAGLLRAKFTSPAYAGSKAAIMHLTKQAASLLSPYGIRANALAPGCKSS